MTPSATGFTVSATSRNSRTPFRASVSLAAHGDTENAESYVENFEAETGWRPAQVGLFGGALLYTQYGFIKRHVMKKIASDKGTLDTDTSRDYVYTEWDGVKRFAEDFLGTL
ncbi:flavodoxin domain-containing protein [Arthrobacter sp. CC3]|uniref:flavodoxin domain-containing protein n=1 Tax=Arthrobacter sp. CC3 TaxID=3029185 RepID=UPI00326530E5